MTDAPAEVGKPLDILQGDFLAVAVDQEEPVTPPSHVPADSAVPRNLDRDLPREAVAEHVFKTDVSALMQGCSDRADGCFQQAPAGLDSPQIGQCDHQPDGPVAAHSQIADIVKKDDAGRGARVPGLAQERAHHDVRSARLIHHRRPEIVVPQPEAGQPVRHAALAEIGTAGDHHAGRLAARVRVDHLDPMRAGGCHLSGQPRRPAPGECRSRDE